MDGAYGTPVGRISFQRMAMADITGATRARRAVSQISHAARYKWTITLLGLKWGAFPPEEEENTKISRKGEKNKKKTVQNADGLALNHQTGESRK